MTTCRRTRGCQTSVISEPPFVSYDSLPRGFRKSGKRKRRPRFDGNCTTTPEVARAWVRERLSGREDLQRAAGDERSERTRSVPSVASRRVAAPYGVDDLPLGRSISSEKRSKFQRATRANLTPD